MTKKIPGIILSRMNSSRLPGKPLLSLGSKTVIEFLVERIQQSARISSIVVATSLNPKDDALTKCLTNAGVAVFRGDEQDVLGRLNTVFETLAAESAAIFFGDGPLICPEVINSVVGEYFSKSEKWDFFSNDLSTTYPPGMELEVVRASALKQAAKDEKSPEIREHGTLHIRRNPKKFKLGQRLAQGSDLRPDVSLELDTPEDYGVLKEIVANFEPRIDFKLAEILAFLDQNPTISKKNADVPRHWKQYRTDPSE